jgi:hypothetical protein
MKLPRRKFLKVGAGSVALVAATGCDQLPHELRGLFSLDSKASGPFQPPAQGVIDPISHALNRAAFGPRPGDYSRIRKLGKTAEEAASAYLEEQLNPEQIKDEAAEYAVRRFETLSEPLGGAVRISTRPAPARIDAGHACASGVVGAPIVRGDGPVLVRPLQH